MIGNRRLADARPAQQLSGCSARLDRRCAEREREKNEQRGDAGTRMSPVPTCHMRPSNRRVLQRRYLDDASRGSLEIFVLERVHNGESNVAADLVSRANRGLPADFDEPLWVGVYDGSGQRHALVHPRVSVSRSAYRRRSGS